MTPETILRALRAEHEASVRLHQHHLDSLTHEDGIRRVLHLQFGSWDVVRDGASLVVSDDEGRVEALRCPCCKGDRLKYCESHSAAWDLDVNEGGVVAFWDGTDAEGADDGRVFCLTPGCDAAITGFTVPEVLWEWA